MTGAPRAESWPDGVRPAPGEAVDLGAPVLPPELEAEVVSALTDAVLAQSAPEELEVFRARRAELVACPGTVPRPERDTALGSGAEVVVLLAPYVVAAATAAVRFLGKLVAGATEEEVQPMLRTWVRRLLHREPADDTGAPVPAATLRRVHDTASTVCRQMGLEDDDALLIADALVGRLSLTGT
ncbi:hypothetical protein [Georgenia muralis]|uniref:Uncharacterized protein n=1 Tax=Georgenia muralis TaxID=154117 RepID=A0A3N4ZA64_9MICO|nr:hypothetical protein [Georgenia muralis]RPF28964.1 hypothetical protein EDD32_3515 [Georgenia muralis]